MKFGRLMQLWITAGLIFLTSAFVYAEEDHIKLSPSDKGHGIYEFTVYGTRDSEVTVESSCYSIYPADNSPGMVGNGTLIQIYLTLRKGVSGVKSSYLEKLDIFLVGGSYFLDFLIKDDTSQENYRMVKYTDSLYNEYPEIIWVSFNILGNFSNIRNIARISLRDAVWNIIAPDILIFGNVAVETEDWRGNKQNFRAWGKFRWNPDTWSWEFRDGGVQ